MVSQTYPTEFELNKAKSFDTDTAPSKLIFPGSRWWRALVTDYRFS